MGAPSGFHVDSASGTWFPGGLGVSASIIPSICPAAAGRDTGAGTACTQFGQAGLGQIRLALPVVITAAEVHSQQPRVAFRKAFALNLTEPLPVCPLAPSAKPVSPLSDWVSIVHCVALGSRTLLVAGPSSRGFDVGDDPATHIRDRHSAYFGLGCDIRAQVPSEAVRYECGVALVRADPTVDKRDLPVVVAWIELGEANPRLQDRIHLLGQFRLGVQCNHDREQSSSPACLRLDPPNRRSALDVAVAIPLASMLRPGGTQSGCATARYRSGSRPSASPPTAAPVFGPRRSGVIEQDGAAASATHVENLLPAVLAPHGVAPRLAGRTMPGNRHYLLRIAVPGIRTCSAETRCTTITTSSICSSSGSRFAMVVRT